MSFYNGILVQACGKKSVPEFIDPVFAKTSPKRWFSMTENEHFGLVFMTTGSINSGTRMMGRKVPGQSVLGWNVPAEPASEEALDLLDLGDVGVLGLLLLSLAARSRSEIRDKR